MSEGRTGPHAKQNFSIGTKIQFCIPGPQYFWICLRLQLIAEGPFRVKAETFTLKGRKENGSKSYN